MAVTAGLFNSSERIFLLDEELIKKDEKQDFWANSHHLREEDPQGSHTSWQQWPCF